MKIKMYEVSVNGEIVLTTDDLQKYLDTINQERDRQSENLQYRSYFAKDEASSKTW